MKYFKQFNFTILFWMLTIGSCAAGDGLDTAGYNGIGKGLTALGWGLLMYLIFVHDAIKNRS